jgi:predicted membrane protein
MLAEPSSFVLRRTNNLMNSPFFVLFFSFVVLWLSARLGAEFRKQQLLEDDLRHDLDVVVGATLTLLGLIIGFTFSMAVSRYDQRKNDEEAEANAIGTEYVRANLLPDTDATRVRALLRDYLDQRILFYQSENEKQLGQINRATAQLQTDLWSALLAPAAARPTPVLTLALSGMNDVLNSQGYTQAAWWNRIPAAAWVLMITIAICANMMFGYGARRRKAGAIHMLVLPLVLSIAFFLIADIDSPRRGVIRVSPQNLISLARSLHVQ